MVDVAKKFNKEGFEVGDKTVAVSVRNVTSGLGVDYIVSGVRVPDYTIGYNGGADLLEQLSDLNEAANIDAESDDVTYKIKNLFNFNM